ncbi:hypothetical protein [Marinactinospora rubrisoli]|uniref:Uncharacterized protein n=1 Tax=Marinactinospora rubrisoli TaxID=2715399 RepID=A0ABW2KLL2_9ACTN
MTLMATSRYQGASMRTFVLFTYILVAGWVAWDQRETAWFVLHATGALAGLCAVSLAVTYVGRLAELDGPDDESDQALDYMEREEWDD